MPASLIFESVDLSYLRWMGKQSAVQQMSHSDDCLEQDIGKGAIKELAGCDR